MMILNSFSPANNYDFRASLSRQSERAKNAIHYFSRNLMDVSAGNSLDSCIGVMHRNWNWTIEYDSINGFLIYFLLTDSPLETLLWGNHPDLRQYAMHRPKCLSLRQKKYEEIAVWSEWDAVFCKIFRNELNLCGKGSRNFRQVSIQIKIKIGTRVVEILYHILVQN